VYTIYHVIHTCLSCVQSAHMAIVDQSTHTWKPLFPSRNLSIGILMILSLNVSNPVEFLVHLNNVSFGNSMDNRWVVLAYPL
jgi:hypothetical protein